MAERMGATLGTLTVLRTLSEGPAPMWRLMDSLEEAGMRRDERTLRRYLAVLREAGFGIQMAGGNYELLSSPVRLPLDDREALATLSVIESLAERDPVYGKDLASAAEKLREAIPKDALKFADDGRIEFDLASASDPPEDPDILDTLRRAVHRNQKIRMQYHSLSSGMGSRTVEPLRVAFAQRAHRLYAYELDKGKVTEFRVNRVQKARILSDKFSPLAHLQTFTGVKIRLNSKAFTAYGKTIIPDPDATITRLEDGGAVIEGTTPSTFWTIRDIASLGQDAEVLGGDEFKRGYLEFLRQILNKYS